MSNTAVAEKKKSKAKSVLADALQKYFGFDSFKGEQEAIIKNVLDGKNTFVIMPTGGGKSMCYQLPALLSEVVSPKLLVFVVTIP